MEKVVIVGQNPLEGRIKVSGAKNAVLPIIAATLLCDGECQLHDVPRLTDVETISSLIESLGVKLKKEDRAFSFNARNIVDSEAPSKYVRKMRASVLVMGPLLARLGYAKISMPGGCNIGSRPIDLHLKGLAALGANFSIEHGTIEGETTGLKGNKVYLDFPSVGATENIMMAASLAEGVTIIENAAEEPEIVDLANFLNSMGGRVLGAGTNVIKIEGVEKLNSTSHIVIPDRIEAGTYMAMAAATRSELMVDNVITSHLKPIIAKLQETGVEIAEEDNGVRIRAPKKLQPIDVKTLPYPGFPTDMQPQMMALMTTVSGTSVITETVFENRFMHTNEFCRMGANIILEGHSAIVKGVPQLSGAQVKANDLRSGAALILAGMKAEGETNLYNINHVDRGYEDIVKKLQGVGAVLERVTYIEDENGVNGSSEEYAGRKGSKVENIITK